MFAALYQLILLRRDTGEAGSYVKKLFQRGQDVMCKKVAEEAAEVLLASKNGTVPEIVYEMADSMVPCPRPLRPSHDPSSRGAWRATQALRTARGRQSRRHSY